ncbi:MAG: YbaB/EbfC family nucleoid-associated protein [Acidobacteria bacterium]|nr:YbaB/EbfC family nucleoid-associated protein [Acidobacteriota bacterium]
MRNLQQMMNQVKKMQEQVQQQLESLRVEASSGGGMVTISMSGNKQVLSVKIEPEVVENSDLEMLQDLIQAAVNEAVRKVDEEVSSKLGGLMGGLNLPGLTP